MRVTKKELLVMVETLNNVHDIFNPDWNTLHSYHLTQTSSGYKIEKVMNDHGGVLVVDNVCGMTPKECYFFLRGLLAKV